MANAFFVRGILLAAAVLFLPADASNSKCGWSREQVLKVYVTGPSPDISTGPGSPTIIAGPGSSPSDYFQSGYSSLYALDQSIREGPDVTSRHLGQSRGLSLVMSNHQVLSVYSFDFVNDKFKGSIAFVGIEHIPDQYRYSPILGGTGDFLLVKGYAILSIVQKEPSDPFPVLFLAEIHYVKAESLDSFHDLCLSTTRKVPTASAGKYDTE